MSGQTQLFLRVKDGPQTGTRILIREGLTLGRKETDLLLQDPKLSVKHAQIEWRDGEWVLIDLGSSNKIKVEGTRYAEVVLYGGLEFMVGSTSIQVIERQAPSATAVRERAELTGSGTQIPAEALSWKEILEGLLNRAKRTEAPLQRAIHAFPTSVRLEFLSGPQHGTVWTLGYGPRDVGARSYDLPLVDSAAELTVNSETKGSCFLIDSAGSKITFQATQGAPVKYNGKKAPPQTIEVRSGDRIQIGKTRIRITID